MSAEPTPLAIHLADDRATALFGEDLLLALQVGDCIALEGDRESLLNNEAVRAAYIGA